MGTPNFSSGNLNGYHSGMILVQTHASASGSVAAMAADGGVTSASGGLAALDAMERAGHVRHVVPIASSQEMALGEPRPARRFGAVAAMANAVRPEFANDPNAGVSLIQLVDDDKVLDLQSALAQDPHVARLSRVPIRYALLPAARKKARQKSRAAAQPRSIGPAASPPAASTMWNLAKIRWDAARSLPGFKDADQVQVAVLDSGIDRDHQDLRDEIDSYIYDNPGLDRASSDRDIIGHGTHVAGTIAASVNNAVGVNGICRCSLKIWKIFDDVADYDRFSQSFVYFVNPIMYLRALGDCLEQGVDVINLSIGGGQPPSFQERELFDHLLARGATVVAAMGNERQFGSPTSYPAAIPGVIAVGATKANDSVADFSNRGGHITLSAPGVGIWSALPHYDGQTGFSATFDSAGNPSEGRPHRREADYDAWDGTSMATPHVSAAAALLLANSGPMTGSSVRDRLMSTADPVSGMGPDSRHPDYGAGRLNLEKLLS